MAKNTNIYRLEKISNTAMKKLDPKRTIVLVTMSPLEVHGPHLPIGQDWFEACSLLEATVVASAKANKDWNYLVMPPIPIATDCLPHTGSVNYTPTLVRDVAYQTLLPFAKRGFARLAISSFHGGPRHICALEDAAHKLSQFKDVAAVSLFSAALKKMFESEDNIFLEALRGKAEFDLTNQQIGEDQHAGFVETSLALHLWPELVEPGWEKLEPCIKPEPESAGSDKNAFFSIKQSGSELSLKNQINKIKYIIEEVSLSSSHYKKHTYAGHPAKASAGNGSAIFDFLVDETVRLVGEFLELGKELDVHSPLWKMHDIILNPALNTVLDDWLKIMTD
jgi:creatinine amidohydrolase